MINAPAIRNAIEANPVAAVEHARALLATVERPQEAKRIADHGDAIALLLRRSGAAIEMTNAATAIVLWSRRRIGELTAAMPTASGGRPARGETRPGSGKFSQLEGLGLSRAEVSRCEELARIEEASLRAHIEGVTQRQRRLTLGGTIAAVSHAEGYEGDEWGSPMPIVEIGRALMGGRIDCDPATNAKAQARIRARTFWTKRTDGLDSSHAWGRHVWLNPPFSRGLIDRFVGRFLLEHRSGRMKRGILLVNAQTDATWFHVLARTMPFILSEGRFGFLDEHGKPHRGARQGQALFAAGIKAAELGRAYREHGQCFGIVRW